MIEVHVKKENEASPWHFSVKVVDGKSSTEHQVTMDEKTYQQLSEGKVSAEACVEGAFRFLLDREPKEAILRQFDITKILYYFPEFDKMLSKYLKK